MDLSFPNIAARHPFIGNHERRIKNRCHYIKLQQEIDTGNILLMEEISIGADETAGELHDRMKEIGAGLVTKTIRGMIDGTPAGKTTGRG